MQRAFLSARWFIKVMNVYYGTLHFIITAGLLMWVYLRRHQHYRQYRNLLGMTTALALIGYFAFPLAPPRMYSRGTTASSTRSTRSAGCGRTTPARPRRSPTRSRRCRACTSAGRCGAARCCGRSPGIRCVRALSVIYPMLTLLAIVVTANHYWLDAVGGAVIFLAASQTLRLLRMRGRYGRRSRSASRSAAWRRAEPPACSPLSIRAISSMRSSPSTIRAVAVVRRHGRARHRLRHHDLGVGKRGDLGEVGHAHHLMAPPEPGERLGDGGRRGAADAGVDLVEHQCLRRFGQHQSQGQHRACQLATAGHPRQREHRQARVGGDEEGDIVTGSLAADGDVHLGMRHRQRAHDVAYCRRQARRARPTHSRHVLCGSTLCDLRRVRSCCNEATRCS